MMLSSLAAAAAAAAIAAAENRQCARLLFPEVQTQQPSMHAVIPACTRIHHSAIQLFCSLPKTVKHAQLRQLA
jgi:hypothetical protein